MKYQITDYSVLGARKINQDHVGYAERDNAVLIALADGLGGHSGGELASALLVQRVLHTFQSIRHETIDQPSAFLALAILQAHEAINTMGQSRTPPIRPRTTCVLCLVQNGYAYWAHVGDSRLYLFRNKHIHTRTQDHTLIEQLRQEGILSEEEMLTHPEKSKLLKCIGGPNKPSIRLGPETRLLPGDTLLICTDGLWEALSADEMMGYALAPNIEDSIGDMLIEAESKMGKRADNITAAMLRWDTAMTLAPALQPEITTEVDHESLWTEVKAQAKRYGKAKASGTSTSDIAGSAATNPKPSGGTPSPKHKTRPDALDNEIAELESFLDQITSKR